MFDIVLLPTDLVGNILLKGGLFMALRLTVIYFEKLVRANFRFGRMCPSCC